MEPLHVKFSRYAAIGTGRGLFYAAFGPPIGGVVILLGGWLRDFEGGLASLATIPLLGLVTWPLAIFLMGVPALVTGVLSGLIPARRLLYRAPANFVLGATSVAAYLALLTGKAPLTPDVGGFALAGGVAGVTCGELLNQLQAGRKRSADHAQS